MGFSKTRQEYPQNNFLQSSCRMANQPPAKPAVGKLFLLPYIFILPWEKLAAGSFLVVRAGRVIRRVPPGGDL